MVICKYFIQGNCRFGNKCRYEHSYSEPERQENYRGDFYDNNSNENKNYRYNQYGNNRYNVLSENRSQSHRDTGGGGTSRRVDHDKENLQSVVNDIECWERGNQWLFSCYLPVKDGENFPGFTDLSPEEIRWKAYHAETEGTGNKYNQELLELTAQVNNHRQKLKSLNPRFVDILRKLFSGVKLESSVIAENSIHTNLIGSSNTGPTGSPSNAFSFKSSATTSSQSAFSNNSTVLGNTSQAFSSPTGSFGNSTNSSTPLFGDGSNQGKNMFGGTATATSPSPNNNIFTQNQTQPQQTSLFQSSQPQQMSFQSQNVETMNIQSAQTQQGALSSFSFAQKPSVPSSGSLFGNVGSQQEKSTPQNFSFNPTQGSLFGNKTSQSNVNEDSKKFSSIDNLTEEDRMQFEAARFTIGKIPEKPPTKELCS